MNHDSSVEREIGGDLPLVGPFPVGGEAGYIEKVRVRVAICGIFVALWALLVQAPGRESRSGRAWAEQPKEPNSSGEGEGTVGGACPTAQWVGATPWRGLLPLDTTAPPRRLCGHKGQWTFVRMRPQGGEIELWWESPEALQVAVGWGSCSSRARACPEKSPLPLNFWSDGAPLWVAIAPSRSETWQAQESGSTSGQASEGKSGAGVPHLPISLGWRARSTPSP